MGQAYKCDLTGKMAEGEGTQKYHAVINENVHVDVEPFVRTGPKSFGSARLSPEACDAIGKAMIDLGKRFPALATAEPPKQTKLEGETAASRPA